MSFRFRYWILAPVLLIIMVVLLQNCFTMRKSDEKGKEAFRKKGIQLEAFYEKIGDRNLHYVTIGSDSLPLLFLFHGSPGSWNDLSALMQNESLRKSFKIIGIDRPGFGYSDFGKALNLQQEADLLNILVGKIAKDQKVYLAGHSLGGPLVALMAADQPERMKAIAIIAGALDPLLEPKERWRKSFMKPPLNYLLPGAFRPSNTELWYLKTDLVLLEKKLPSISCPVWIMHAKNDILVDFKNVAFMQKKMAHTRLHISVFEKGNHFFPFTKSDTVAQILLEML